MWENTGSKNNINRTEHRLQNKTGNTKKVQLLTGTCYLFLQCKEEWRLIFVDALEWIEASRHQGNGVVGILYQQEVLGPAGRVMYQCA